MLKVTNITHELSGGHLLHDLAELPQGVDHHPRPRLGTWPDPSPPEATIHSSVGLALHPCSYRLHQSLVDRLVRHDRGVRSAASFLPSHRYRCTANARGAIRRKTKKPLVKSRWKNSRSFESEATPKGVGISLTALVASTPNVMSIANI